MIARTSSRRARGVGAPGSRAACRASSQIAIEKRFKQLYEEQEALVKKRDEQAHTAAQMQNIELARRALTKGLAVGPGRHFVVAEEDAAYLRLCFAALPEQHIDAAVRILADSL